MSDNLAILGVVAIAAMMLRTWWLHREKMKGLSMTNQALSPSDERLARVEQAVESIAIEVERIGEGQRFVTKLMNDRAQPMPERVAIPAQPRKVDTPH
ncbi:MAG TPA: hypothetical protein VGJ12_14005 [Gemmatimonadaceae bacterium]|jgi:hypothetical protein